MRTLGSRYRDSLITRLLVASLLFVVFGHFARYVFLTTTFREDLKALVSAERLSLAQHVAWSLDARLSERQDLLGRVAGSIDPSLLSQPAAVQAWLEERQALLPAFGLGLAVVDRGGSMVAGWAPGPTSDLRARLRGASGAIASSLRGENGLAAEPVAGQLALPMTAPIVDGSGRVVAAVVGICTLSSLHPFDIAGDGGQPLDHGSLLLVSPKDHLFLASTVADMALKPTPPAGVNKLHDQAMEGLRGTGVTVNAQGVEELSAMVSVPSAGWFVVARIPTAEAYSVVSRTKSFLMVGSVLTACIVIGFVCGIFSWTLAPLFKAVRQAEAMTRGDIALQELPVVRQDEVGMMTTAFNRLLSKLAATQRELSQLAFHDSLTGLPNRRLLADRVRQSLARSERHRTCVALMVLDLDGFKQINDLHGHDAGDEALRVMADRFVTALRRNDTLARLGGDEFVLLASDLSGSAMDAEDAARAIAAKCISIASAPLNIPSAAHDLQLGVSIGIAVCAAPCDPEALMEAADQAMYEAKRAGRGRYAMARFKAQAAPKELAVEV